MAKPTLTINGHDYAQYIQQLTPSRNDLDADGSGRDVQTGLMYRTLIARKAKLEIKLCQVRDTVLAQLMSDISDKFYSAKYLDPVTNTQKTATFYTSEVNLGEQHYDKSSGATRYTGASFSMIER